MSKPTSAYLAVVSGIALRGEGDVAAVGEEHAVFLHGAGDNPGSRRELRHVIPSLEAEVDAHGRSGIGPAGRAGMRGGMDIDSLAHARIGKNEANGVVDASFGQLVGAEEQRGDGKSGGIGAGAAFSATGGRIDAIEVPDREEGGVESAIGEGSLPGFIELAMTAVDDDQVAIFVVGMALIV